METANFEQYRLNDYKWVDIWLKKLGKKEFWKYLNNVYKALQSLQLNHFYTISAVPEEKRELFVKCCCSYIIDFKGCDSCGIQFSDDYSRIIKYKQLTNE